MLKLGLPHRGILRMEGMLPTLDWVLGRPPPSDWDVLREGKYHPYQNGVPASEVCFSSIRQASAGGIHISYI